MEVLGVAFSRKNRDLLFEVKEIDGEKAYCGKINPVNGQVRKNAKWDWYPIKNLQFTSLEIGERMIGKHSWSALEKKPTHEEIMDFINQA